MDDKNTTFSDALLKWYDTNHRNLVFRKDHDPYKIWISEIMAQQTRIEAMLPYFERFIKRYPSVTELAASDDDELLALWQGLGYYSRARNLKKAALQCVELYDGMLPQNYEELKKLPGIGEYTAGAIASIAYEEKVAAIDGNVIRVFSRLERNGDDFSRAANKRLLADHVKNLLPEKRVGDFNQALMEIGALICLPKHPRCSDCPLKKHCQGYASKDMEKYPVRAAAKEKIREDKRVVVRYAIREGNLYFHLRKRPDSGLLAGMYEFDESFENPDAQRQPLKSYQHVFTHRVWSIKGYLEKTDWKEEYVDESNLNHYAIPSAFLPCLQSAMRMIYDKEKIRQNGRLRPGRDIIK